MAKAYKCDRCGKIFGKHDIYKKDDFGFDWAEKIKRTDIAYGLRRDIKMDLCPKCASKLDDFLYSKHRKKRKENDDGK